MPVEPSIPTPAPILQFRLRSLLGFTALAAVLAAVAGTYYRALSASAQTHLLIFWITSSILAAMVFGFRWRFAGRVPSQAGFAKLLVHAAPKGRHLVWLIFRHFFFIAACLLLIALTSAAVVNQSEYRSYWTPLVRSMQLALLIGVILRIFLNSPTFLTEDGVASAGSFTPWGYIRHAEWLKNAPGVMKFRRLDGDLFIAVAKRDRVAVEAFVRAKTTLLNPAPHTPEVCDANENPQLS